MAFDPTLAAIRFGYGLSPRIAAPASVSEMVARLAGPDQMARRIPIVPYATATPSSVDYVRLRRAQNAAKGTATEAQTGAAVDAWRADAAAKLIDGGLRTFARAAHAEDAMRERLVAFWADHFTVRSRNSQLRHLVSATVEEAIRPHVTGRFADMLTAMTLHPLMLHYLQQTQSVGPNSIRASNHGGGLNENLARELLELHSLGVDGNYSQTDVRELAELLTGLTVHPLNGFTYNPRYAEPGAETILGLTFSADATLDTVKDALESIANHPDTARHIAQKLVVHFVSDTPDAGLVKSIAQAFVASDGNLMETTKTLLQDPRAWVADKTKVKSPIEFIAASFRALDVPENTILSGTQKQARDLISRPLRVMGQPWQQPTGPDGWPEKPSDWIIPQAMAGRITWAMSAPEKLLADLPDPRNFVNTALGDHAPQALHFAASAAETKAEGIGIILASPAFQRR